MQSVLATAKEYGGQLTPEIATATDWPWKLVRIAEHIDAIRFAVELAAMNKCPMPPKEMMLNRKKVKRWVDEHKPKKESKEPPRGRL